MKCTETHGSCRQGSDISILLDGGIKGPSPFPFIFDVYWIHSLGIVFSPVLAPGLLVITSFQWAPCKLGPSSKFICALSPSLPANLNFPKQGEKTAGKNNFSCSFSRAFNTDETAASQGQSQNCSVSYKASLQGCSEETYLLSPRAATTQGKVLEGWSPSVK